MNYQGNNTIKLNLIVIVIIVSSLLLAISWYFLFGINMVREFARLFDPEPRSQGVSIYLDLLLYLSVMQTFLSLIGVVLAIIYFISNFMAIIYGTTHYYNNYIKCQNTNEIIRRDDLFMCQLNLFLVQKLVDKDSLDKIIKNSKIPYFEFIKDYPILTDKYNLISFNAKDTGCTCDSIIAVLNNTHYKNFEEYKVLSVKEKAEKLEQIADYMLETGYKERLKLFNEELNKKSDSMTKLSDWIGNKERELTDEIMLRSDISDKEKSRRMHKTVYPKITELLQENEKNPEVIEAREAYSKFIADNQMMWDSSVYTLDEVEPQTFETVPLTLNKAIELSGYQHQDSLNENNETDSESYPTITIPSNNIFDAIKANKEFDYSDYTTEFKRIKDFVKELLAIIDEVKIISFYWYGDNKVEGKKEINLSDLCIDDLLFLPSATELIITNN